MVSSSKLSEGCLYKGYKTGVCPLAKITFPEIHFIDDTAAIARAVGVPTKAIVCDLTGDWKPIPLENNGYN